MPDEGAKWYSVNDEFAWTELTPPPPDREGQHTVPFRIFLVHVKTGEGRELGVQANNDPIGFFREHIEEMGIPPVESGEVRAQLLRVNAELPANAHWVRLLATVATNSPVNVTVVHYKDQTRYSDDPA
jgi:hypothetical protein